MEIRAGRPIRTLVIAGCAVALLVIGAQLGRLQAQIVTARPADLRYEMLLNEPVAAPGRNGVVAGTSALVVKDVRTGRCYVAVTIGGAMGMAPTEC